MPPDDLQAGVEDYFAGAVFDARRSETWKFGWHVAAQAASRELAALKDQIATLRARLGAPPMMTHTAPTRPEPGWEDTLKALLANGE